ncbi:MAG: peptidoglycan DD-metalloendopeptidase family protein [Candidatus Hydrogenedentes bacterium]|nr:peptidoglycan DD-metalloendopeptidase family protein [Candidatus Hydrogenedentota bacterium]
MVIKPVQPATPPELGEAPSLRTLPFRQDSRFMELLQAATTAKVSASRPPVDHQVRAGESLWSICRDALKANGDAPTKSAINAAVHRVAASNKLRDADVISVGQKLDLSELAGNSPIARGQIESRRDVPPLMPAQGVAETNGVPSKEFHATGPVTARAPLATLSETRRGTAMGGAQPTLRPIFHRLSNARPMLHTHTPFAHVNEAAAESAKPVDLTALMQSILEPGTAAREAAPAAGPWSKLLAGAGRFTSGFGVRSDPFSGKPQFHQGIDIAAAAGTEIYPYMPGTVKSAGWDGGHGNMVVIQHPNGMETVYAHASELLVKTGDVVLKDTPIAKVGSTGRSTGSHLHFEVRQNNKAVNPLPLIKQDSLDVAKAL